QYHGDELSRIQGHLGIWTRSIVDDQGNATWTSDTDQDWKGEFKVDSEGNLHFIPLEGQAWIFTRDGRDLKADSPEGKAITSALIESSGKETGDFDVEIVVEEVSEDAAPVVAADAEGAEKVLAPSDAGDKSAPLTDVKVSDVTTERKPLTPEQQKAAIGAANALLFETMFSRMTLEEVQKALYGKSEAEIQAMEEAFKRIGLDLEALLKKELDGAELGKALDLLRHKDTDLVPIAEGLDRLDLMKTAEAIHDRNGGWFGGLRAWMKLSGMTSEELKATAALYKDRYGIELADELKDELSTSEFQQIAKLLPQTREYPDESRVQIVQEKVVEATAADGRGREFKYDGDKLMEVKSTFTGHTWKRTVIDGTEAWVNEKGKVWKGSFALDSDGNLGLTPHGRKTAFIFTRDGKTQRVPTEAVAEAAAAPEAKESDKAAAPVAA